MNCNSPVQLKIPPTGRGAKLGKTGIDSQIQQVMHTTILCAHISLIVLLINPQYLVSVENVRKISIQIYSIYLFAKHTYCNINTESQRFLTSYDTVAQFGWMNAVSRPVSY